MNNFDFSKVSKYLGVSGLNIKTKIVCLSRANFIFFICAFVLCVYGQWSSEKIWCNSDSQNQKYVNNYCLNQGIHIKKER